MPDQDDKCYDCGRPLRSKRVAVQIVDQDQWVYVGADCAKRIDKTGHMHYWPHLPAVRKTDHG